mmetsp:Transcript_10231/g.33786  ORF Transcript_10231/g.33786 Transcript_10231/m.33786 type:complete len:285 (+) Transcript_10231:755-1609(+)|eukprot:CAMPEP_0118913706 /NCGR_PEP_ID=MMETSP1166-20130328/14397_1 /TAXON_ID=1104430 /ORGANISM="Chrysoreinhardia sp, Strain CCMP3193" /LENGTH=284 /DNA_ID=CAMNT_0006853271 /DNA_START=108 /DNA_END=962 /DNA_ORIENTATION=+
MPPRLAYSVSEEKEQKKPRLVEVLGPYGLIEATHQGCPAGALQAARVDLAACYRLLDQLGLNEGVDNHLTVMVPGTTDRFLCIAYGVLWSEVTASNLLLLDQDGAVLEGSGSPDPTAFYIHSRIHAAHPHATCVLHTHMPYATALTCLEEMELKMIHQNSCRFYDEIAYDYTYNGLVLGDKEGDRLADVMKDKRVLMHQNHGVITVGEDVATAFDELYYLERAALVQVLAMSTGKPMKLIQHDVVTNYKDQVSQFRGVWAAKHFEARKRCLFKPTGLGHADFSS